MAMKRGMGEMGGWVDAGRIGRLPGATTGHMKGLQITHSCSSDVSNGWRGTEIRTLSL